ncbi:MAG: hypothetical protein TR69_WS6001000134 [candidate division WS6 bacterium OLB20]|uniref:Uncharacterized protein n=1 Tax=candidate division WS6 bacterium OLB20 TaxID=1617426 RepID=A0A136M030_9BACT|nr:MAG: hypothetical protein TR69_WS6001000134 [candidate division WS6 bacterium OLB20]
MHTFEYLIHKIISGRKLAQSYREARAEYLKRAGLESDPEVTDIGLVSALLDTDRYQSINNPYCSYVNTRRLNTLANEVGQVVHLLPQELKLLGDASLLESIFFHLNLELYEPEREEAVKLAETLKPQLHGYQTENPTHVFAEHLERANDGFFSAVMHFTGYAIALGPRYEELFEEDDNPVLPLETGLAMPVELGRSVAKSFSGPVQSFDDLMSRLRMVFPAPDRSSESSLYHAILSLRHSTHSRQPLLRAISIMLGDGDVTEVTYRSGFSVTRGKMERHCPAAQLTKSILSGYGRWVSESPEGDASQAAAYKRVLSGYLEHAFRKQR